MPIRSYQDSLVVWKDADPDIPILKEAKAEYAKLHQLLGSLKKLPRGRLTISGS
jgi:hypothetical protein